MIIFHKRSKCYSVSNSFKQEFNEHIMYVPGIRSVKVTRSHISPCILDLKIFSLWGEG